MGRINAQASATIDRPAEEVYQYVADNDTRYTYELALMEIHPEGSNAFREVRMWMGRRIEEIYEIEADGSSRIVARSRPGQGSPAELTRTETIEGSNGTTRYSVTLEMDDGGMFPAVATGLVQRTVQRELEANTGHLKDLLEADDEVREALERLPAHAPR
jgi:hypothetical protein